MSYLNFVPDGSSPSGKTKKFIVETLGGTPLLSISWYAPWRKYTVNTGGATFDSSCLREIADFLDSANREHKGV